MKTLKNIILILALPLFLVFTECKKDSTKTTPDPTPQATAMLKNYQSASNADVLLVKYHQRAGIGNHDSCSYYWHQFNQYDSLFSFSFYDYCRNIYANNGGHNYGMGGWNWNMNNNNCNSGSWQCGLDTLQFQNWNGFGNCMQHDSLMYHMMQGYNMTGYFSTQSTQCYSNMQSLRADHYKNHNYHW